VVGDRCERVLTQTVVCDTDKVLNNDLCRTQTTENKQNTCLDDSFVLNNTVCEKVTHIAVDCGEGSDYFAANNVCLTTSTSSIDLQCGDGWSLVPGGCSKTSLLTKVLECPSGFTMNKTLSVCERTEQELASFDCTLPSNLMPEEIKCEVITSTQIPPVSYFCPSDDYTLSGSLCIKGAGTTYCEDPTHELIETSLEGELTQYTCQYEEIVSTPADFVCPELGQVLVADAVCVKDIIVPPIEVCHPTYTEVIGPDGVSKMCATEVTRYIPFDYTCIAPFNEVNGQCRYVQSAPMSFTCQGASETLVGAFCIGEEIQTAAPTRVCKNENVDGKCEQNVYTTPVYSCATDYTLNTFRNVCEKDDVEIGTVPSNACLPDYTLIGGLCNNTLIKPSYQGCPGSVWVLDAGKCTKTTESKYAYITCEPGDIEFNNKCYTVVTDVPFDGCSNGFTHNTTTNICEVQRVDIKEVVYACFSGSMLVADTCVTTLQEPVAKICNEPEHSILNGRCYESTITMGTPNKQCPTGFTESAGLCVITNTFVAEFTCGSQDYVYNDIDDTCDRVSSSTKSASSECPAGYNSLTSRLCQRTLTSVIPSYDCDHVDDATLSGTNCLVTIDLEEDSGYCDPAYYVVGGVCVQIKTKPYELGCTSPAFKNANRCVTETVTTETPTQTCD
jgi:hypothetical protein